MLYDSAEMGWLLQTPHPFPGLHFRGWQTSSVSESIHMGPSNDLQGPLPSSPSYLTVHWPVVHTCILGGKKLPYVLTGNFYNSYIFVLSSILYVCFP